MFTLMKETIVKLIEQKPNFYNTTIEENIKMGKNIPKKDIQKALKYSESYEFVQNLREKENRKARFRTVIALILNGKEYLFEGIVNGTIINEKRGESGFGYDPIFVPDTYSQTFAEMGNDIKNQISHRAEAVKKLTAFLSNYTF